MESKLLHDNTSPNKDELSAVLSAKGSAFQVCFTSFGGTFSYKQSLGW